MDLKHTDEMKYLELGPKQCFKEATTAQANSTCNTSFRYFQANFTFFLLIFLFGHLVIFCPQILLRLPKKTRRSGNNIVLKLYKPAPA